MLAILLTGWDATQCVLLRRHSLGPQKVHKPVKFYGAVNFASMKSSSAFSKQRHATPTPLRAATSSGRHGSRALKPGASTRPYVLVKSTATRRPRPVN